MNDHAAALIQPMTTMKSRADARAAQRVLGTNQPHVSESTG